MGIHHFPGAWQQWHPQAMAAIEVVLGDITEQCVDAIGAFDGAAREVLEAVLDQ